MPPEYLQMHPFGRVPVLSHDGFTVYETAAIAGYIDAVFPELPLMPTEPRALARAVQVIGIVDSYAYWPMVRQVFSHAVFRPLVGESSNRDEIVAGLAGSHRALTALESIASEGLVLNGERMTLADRHLAPMIDYFVRSVEGTQALNSYPSLMTGGPPLRHAHGLQRLIRGWLHDFRKINHCMTSASANVAQQGASKRSGRDDRALARWRSARVDESACYYRGAPAGRPGLNRAARRIRDQAGT